MSKVVGKVAPDGPTVSIGDGGTVYVGGPEQDGEWALSATQAASLASLLTGAAREAHAVWHDDPDPQPSYGPW